MQFPGYFAWLARTHARHNVVAIKLAIPHLEMLGDSCILDQIVDRSRFVFLTREDCLGQAISLEIASQTGRWTSNMVSERTPRFSARRVRRHLASIAAANELFETFFARNGIAPLRIVYERLVEEPGLYVREIGRQLGFHKQLEIDPARLSLGRQAGTLNAEWRASFLAETARNPLLLRVRRVVQRIGVAPRRPSS